MPTILRPGFVAIYASINGTSRIVGYGFADAGFSTSNPGGVRVQLRQGILAPGGSSTPDVRVWVAANGVSAQIGSDTPQLNASEWQQVFERNSFLAYGGDNNAPTFAVVYDHTKVRPGTLMAPALAR
jgi:hypothetical protein